jgi:hypothetical protein
MFPSTTKVAGSAMNRAWREPQIDKAQPRVFVRLAISHRPRAAARRGSSAILVA